MPKKKTSKDKEIESKYPEAKGLLIICVCLCLLTSLISFIYLEPSANFFGLVGYYLAFAMQFLFGLSSYLALGITIWMGWKLLTEETIPSFGLKITYSVLLCLSCSVLLNLYADIKGMSNPILVRHLITENYTIKLPYHHTVTRFNAGGIPLYYLFKDLPTFNLKNLLSNVGCGITFSILGLVSFLLLTDIGILSFLKAIPKVFLAIINFLKTFAKSFKTDSLKLATKSFSFRSLDSVFKKTKPFDSQPEKSYSENLKPLSIETDIAYEVEVEKYETKPAEKKDIPVQTYEAKDLDLKEKSTILSTLKKTIRKNYKLPPSSLLSNAKKIDKPILKRELRRQAEVLEETLASFGIEAKVGQINCGPTIASFEVHPAIGVKVQKIKVLEDDIALNLQAKSIRIIAPIPGKAAVGVEIPSMYPQEVGFKDMLTHYQMQRRKFAIPVLLGKTVTGEDVTCDLTKMPHCIIAGATGSGKSVCINTIIMSILMNSTPDQLKLLLIDPKKVELSGYSELPHMIAPVITESHGAYAALQWLVKEMQYRYEVFKHLSVRNITSFNTRSIDKEKEESLQMEIPEKMHYIVAIIDEFADLMMASSADLETPIARIAQMARAVGIHLILATQRPSREVITGLIKANFPTRIAFKVSSRVNSQIILDENGAETLLGNGDMLFMPPGSSQLIRAQGAFIRDEDINKVVDFHQSQSPPEYLIRSFDHMSKDDFLAEEKEGPKDSLYDKALTVVTSSRTASTTFLQRKLKIGYARAASLMDELEERGIISPQEGSRPRKVLKNPSLLEDTNFPESS